MKFSIYLVILLLFPPLSGGAGNPSFKEAKMAKLLSLSLEELIEVKVETASKVAEKISEIPASVVLLTRQDIQRYGYTSLAEILQHVSGLYEIDYYGLGGVLHGIRGYVSVSGSNRSIFMLVNGISQIADYSASYSLMTTSVPVEAIDRIEIVRGPLSVIYGSGAFFGAINIITNDVPTDQQGFASYASVMAGSRESRRWFGRTSYKHPDGGFVFNVSTYETTGLSIPYHRLESKPRGLEGDLTTGGRLENQENYLEFSGNYQNFFLDLTYKQSDKEGFLTQPTVNKGSVYDIHLTHLRLGYKKELSEKISLDSHFTIINNDVEITYDGVLPNSWGIQDIKSTTYEGEMTVLWKPQPLFELLSGLYGRYVPKLSTYLHIPSIKAPALHQATQRLASGEALSTWACFSQFNYYPTPQWKWVAGLRLEQLLGYHAFAEQGSEPSEYQQFTPYYDDQDIAVIPRLAAIYTSNEQHIFKWMYGKAINSPSFGQNTTARLTSDLPKLEAEHIETLEFDYLTYLSPHYLLGVNLFHNRLQKLLTRVITLTPSGEYTNFLGNDGKWTTNGVELSLQAQPTDKLQLEFNVTYQKTKDHQHPEMKVSYSPPWLGQFKLNYQWDRQWNLGLTSYYVSHMESYFDGTLKNPDGNFGRRTGAAGDSYWVVNANVRFENWLSRGTFFNVHLYHWLGPDIHYPTFPSNSWIDKGTFGWERSIMVTIGYEF